MEFNTAWASVQNSWGMLTALAVTYSFSVLGAVFLIIVGFVAARLVERGIKAGLRQVQGFDATLQNFFSKLARYLVLILVLVMVLGQFGVQTASIIAAIGAIGLAIGLALQGTLQNIAAGIMILVLRPFRIGESITVGSVSGDVEDVGLFATRLRGADGTYILAPNAKLWNEPVFNSTRNRLRRNDITLHVAYSNDFDRIRQTLAELAKADERVLKDRPPLAFISDISDISIAVNLRYWTTDTNFLKTKLDLTSKALARLTRDGVRFPPPAFAPTAEAETPEGNGKQPARTEARTLS